MPIQVVQFNVKTAEALSKKIVAQVQEQEQIASEVALLMAYATIARGVARYPLSTMNLRAQLFVQRGARALSRAVEDVGALSDAEVFEEVRRG